MYRRLKRFNKTTILKITLLILVLNSLLMLTACGEDEDEMVINSGEENEKIVTSESEPSFDLMVSIMDGESKVRELTGEEKLGTGYIDSIGTDIYDPDNPFKITRDARPIRKIVKQDVYGNILTDDFYFYRNTLDKNEQRVYDQIYANAVELDPYFSLTTKVKTSRMRDIFDSVRLDNPDLFWLSTSYSYSYDNNDNVTSMTLKFFDMVNNLDPYKKVFYDCADSVLEYVMQFDNEIDKIKYVHDLLTNINDYEFGPLDQSAYSGICLGKTVCAGYSNAFQYFMQRLGIPSAVLFGYAGENHAWSMVYLDGDYYEMDVTWNDPIGNPPTTYYYDYFNITSSKIAPTRTRNDISIKLPKANGTVYSFHNWYGSDPGRDFSSISYGKPKTNLPHLYPELDTQYNPNNKPVNVDNDKVDKIENVEKNDKVEEIDKDNIIDLDELETIIAGWSDEEWDDLWNELSEYLSDEELDHMYEMDWDEFIDLIYYMFYEE